MARLPGWGQAVGVSAIGGVAALLAWVPMNRLGLSGDLDTTWLAPFMAGGLLAWLLLLSERWRYRARLPAATAARLADLQTRIRPHFLFNTLNTAIALVQVDPRRAEEVLEDLAELFRAALGAMDEATTLKDEVALSRRYLDIEQLRFGSRLRLTWDLDPQADDARLPPLVLQPLIENAVRHGVEPSDRGADRDPHPAPPRPRADLGDQHGAAGRQHAAPRHGIGLASVRERLRLMHDLDCDFRSGLIEDGRWRVSLGVPA
jgi:two-component system sensor histidine kinase AlgZ